MSISTRTGLSINSLEGEMIFKMTKRKLYWILLIPFVFIFGIALISLPETKRNYSVFIPLLFWIVYYSVIKIYDIKTKQKN